MSRIEIPIDGPEHAKHLIATIEKMKFKYRYRQRGTKCKLIVEYAEPIDLYFLGATAVADAHGIFKTPLTR